MIKIVLERLIKDERLLEQIDGFLYNRKSREFIHSKMYLFYMQRLDGNNVNNWKLLARDIKVAQIKNICQYNGLMPPHFLRFIL